jgi:hypothetical protein
MKNTITNKINSFNATLAVADQEDFQPIWSDKPPVAFGTGLAAVRPLLAALATKGARQSTSITGDAEALKNLRADFEKYLHRLARATFQTLTRLGRTEDAAKADLTPSDLQRCRAQALAGAGEIVLDLAEPLSTAPAAGGDAPGAPEGITPEMVEKVDGLWQRYSAAVGAPAGARAGRKALTDSLPRDASDLEAKFAALDDLVIQFDESPKGAEFVAAWFNARQVVDLGRRAAKPTPSSTPPSAKP